MFQQRIVRDAYGVVGEGPMKGYPLYPGEWVETWIKMAGAGVWMLVSFEPKTKFGGEAA